MAAFGANDCEMVSSMMKINSNSAAATGRRGQSKQYRLKKSRKNS
jgi:hypothetical protein